MKITVESTDVFAEVDGVQTRVWRGFTASGVAIDAFIPLIAVLHPQDVTQFQEELMERQVIPVSEAMGKVH